MYFWLLQKKTYHRQTASVAVEDSGRCLNLLIYFQNEVIALINNLDKTRLLLKFC